MKKTIVILLTIAIPIIAFICWDLYSEKKALEVKLVSSLSLLGEDPIIDELTILYNNKPITNLTKMHFAMINTGKKPLIEEEIKSLPIIDFGENAKILTAKITQKEPPNIECKIKIDDDFSSLSFDFSLLNPNDIIEFDVYLAGSLKEAPIVSARIKGVKKVIFVDKTKERVKISRHISWWFYVLVFYTISFFVMSLVALKENRQQSRLKRLLIDNTRLIENLDTWIDFSNFIEGNMSFVSEKTKKEIKGILDSDHLDWETNRKPRLKNKITYYIKEDKTTKEMLIGFIIITIFFSAIIIFYLIRYFSS